MQKTTCSVLTAAFSLLLCSGTATAQEVIFSPGPLYTVSDGIGLGGFSWGDVNGDGTLDLFIPPNNVFRNNVTSFTQMPSAATANIPINANSTCVLLADFNGNGFADLFTTNAGDPKSGLLYDSAGIFVAATNIGDLATAGETINVFGGMTVADIDHNNYLDLAWGGGNPLGPYYGDGEFFPPGLGVRMLKGGPAGFTNVGKGATPANLSIDTTLSFEAWNPSFIDATNDGYPDLFMPSFRHGFSPKDTNNGSGARKGSVLFLNDGTGKFIVPTAATLGRIIYSIDAASYLPETPNVFTASTTADTGIIVDDTVRHFNVLGNTWGDLNNDGNEDLMLVGASADNRDGHQRPVNVVLLYGKGDGTFTYKWNGINIAEHGLPQTGGLRGNDIGDYNNDGKADIFSAWVFNSNKIFRNNGDGTFTDVNPLSVALIGGGARSGGFVDYDNNGFMDIFTYTGGISLLLKSNGNTNHWIAFRPVGAGNNKSAIGARFTLYIGNGTLKQIRTIKGDGGAGGGIRPIANFGIGASQSIDSVRVLWPDGSTQKWSAEELSANGGTTVIDKYWTIQQGATIPPAPTTNRPAWTSADTSLTSIDTLKWNSVTGGTGAISYQAQVSTVSNFSTVFRDVTGLTETAAIVRLNLSTKYYWRVRAFSAGFTGPWSAIDSFHTKIIPCDSVPKLLLPTTNQLTVPKQPVLKVSYVPEASTYHIQVDSVNRFTTQLVLNDSVNILDTAFTMNLLTSGKKYYWRVRGWNVAGSSAWSAVDSFAVMFIPATPVLAYPTPNQANVNPTGMTFKWRRVAGDSNYIIQYWTYWTSGMQLKSDTIKHDTSFTAASLAYRSRYYWKVMAFNQGGAGEFSAVDSFTTAIEPPGAPPCSFSPRTTCVERNPIFTWCSTLNATRYHLQVASANNTYPGNTVVDTVVADTTVRIADTLNANTTYFWRVAAQNNGGEGPFSATRFFVTGLCPDGVEQVISEIPKEFALLQNYPNPFNPSTTIRFDLPKDAYVKITIYDVLGREVTTLADGEQPARRFRIDWTPSSLSSGVYFYRIYARSLDGSGEFSAVKKLLFVK